MTDLETRMEFEYASTDFTFTMKTPVVLEDLDTMDLDAWRQEINLVWNLQLVMRPDMIREFHIFVPDQEVELSDGEIVKIVDCEMQYSPKDFEYLSKISMSKVVMNDGKFTANL